MVMPLTQTRMAQQVHDLDEQIAIWILQVQVKAVQ